MTYRQLFDDAIGPAPVSTVTVEEVIARQRRAAVLRPVVAALVVLLVLAGAAVAIGASGADEAAPPADPHPDGFPEYAHGLHVFAQAWSPLTDQRLPLRFVSDNVDDLAILVRCESTGEPLQLDLELHVGPGTVSLTGFCGERTFWPSPSWAPWAQAGVPSEISLRVTGGLPAQGRLGLAVGVLVPFEEYRLPAPPDRPRPWDGYVPTLTERYPKMMEQLTELGLTARPEDRVEVGSDPDDPARPREVTIRWPEREQEVSHQPGIALDVAARSQTPGQLHLYVDGVRWEPTEHGPLTFWDYDQEVAGATLAAAGWDGWQPPAGGQEITITIVPEHVTGAWTLALEPTP